VNTAAPIWRRSKSEVEDEDYQEFFTSVLRNYDSALSWSHFKVEGDVEFTGLVYIPNSPPSLVDVEKASKMRLYVKRVFITDDFENLLPSYLNFLQGVIDSDDLPLNVSREMLQQSKVLDKIRRKLLRKIVGMFQEMRKKEPEKFDDFYEKYATFLKLGVIQDPANKDRLSKLLRFPSAIHDKEVTFEEYVENMKEGQETIYFLGGETLDKLKASPLIERIVNKGYDVMLMEDPLDEYVTGNLRKYDNKYEFVDVGKDGLSLDADDDFTRDILNKLNEPLTNYLKDVLADRILKATPSMRLTTSPAAIVAGQYGFSANMERVMKAQALRDERYTSGPAQKYVFEYNPRHPILKKMLERIEAGEQNEELEEMANLLYDAAALTSGFDLKNPRDLAERVNRLVATTLDVDPNAEVEEETIIEAPPTDPIPPAAEEEEVQEEL
jgi:HSP90 family molecular chaperone